MMIFKYSAITLQLNIPKYSLRKDLPSIIELRHQAMPLKCLDLNHKT